MCDKTTAVCTFHILSTQELFPIEKMATAGMGNKKIATTAGLAAFDNEAVVVEAPLGGRDGVVPRGAEADVCRVFLAFSSHISRIARDLCVFSVVLMMKSGACQDADQRLVCHRAVLFSRQCSQTSAGMWH